MQQDAADNNVRKDQKHFGSTVPEVVTTQEDDWSQQPSIQQQQILQQLNSLYEEYTFATAKDASLTDDLRDQQHPKHCEDSLVYGEVDLAGFCQLLSSSSLEHSNEGYFYDLGSGSGRAVFAARFLGNYQNCIGVELLPNLHQLATSVASLYKFQYQHQLHEDCRRVQFVCSDILDYESWWSHPVDDSVTIYIPNLLFDKALSDQIARKALQVQPGTIVMCLKQFTIAEWDQCFYVGTTNAGSHELGRILCVHLQASSSIINVMLFPCYIK